MSMAIAEWVSPGTLAEKVEWMGGIGVLVHGEGLKLLSRLDAGGVQWRETFS